MIDLIPNWDPNSLLTHCFLILEKVFSSVGNAKKLLSPAPVLPQPIPLLNTDAVYPFSVAEFRRPSILVVARHTFLACVPDIQASRSDLVSV